MLWQFHITDSTEQSLSLFLVTWSQTVTTTSSRLSGGNCQGLKWTNMYLATDFWWQNMQIRCLYASCLNANVLLFTQSQAWPVWQIIRLRSSCLFVEIITKMNMQLWIASVTLHKAIPSHKLAANVRLGALPFPEISTRATHYTSKLLIGGLWRPGIGGGGTSRLSRH